MDGDSPHAQGSEPGGEMTPAMELRGRVQRLRKLMRLIDERTPDSVALTGVRYRDAVYRNPRVRGQYLHR